MATKFESMVHALRELVLTEKARLHALRDLTRHLNELSETQIAVIKAHVTLAAIQEMHGDKPVDYDDALLAIIEQISH